jgi:tRNA uridine 5-carboxymethylaminomethyl modification enzyme
MTPAGLLALLPDYASIDPAVLERVHIDAKYNVHVARQEADVRAFLADEHLVLDPGIDYAQVQGLSSEVKERLAKVRPTSIVSGIILLEVRVQMSVSFWQGVARRMEGMTPSSIVYLLKYAKRTHRKTFLAPMPEESDVASAVAA